MIIGVDASKVAISERTGVENYVYQVILYLQKVDRKNTYYLYTNKRLPKGYILNKNFIEKYIPFPKFWNKIRLPLALLKDRPDKYFQPVYMIPQFSPRKTLGVFHDLAWHFFPEAYSNEEFFLQKQAVKNLKEKAAAIICVSRSAKKDLLSLYPELAKKINVVYPSGHDEFKLIQKPADVLNLNQRYFLAVGRLEDRKNSLGLIKAFILAKETANLPHKLVLIGKPGHGYEKIAQFIAQNPKHSTDIIFPGYIEKEKLNDLFSGADAFVFPSLYEGFGIAVLEAMQAGAPIITSNSSSLPEATGNAAILVDPKDTKQIADAMIKVANDPILRNELVQKSLKKSGEYSWLKTATEIYHILEEL